MPKLHLVHSEKMKQLIFKFSLVCLVALFSLQAQGQQRDTQREYNIDSVLYVYYQRCKAEINSPVIMQMTDTLFQMAAEKGDQRMQAVALSTKLDYHYFQNQQKDSIIYYVEVVKAFARKTNQPKYYYFAWSKRLVNFYIKNHHYNIALYEADKMMKDAEKDGYMDGIGNSYNALSNIYQIKKLYNLAIQNKERELDIILKYDLDKYNLSNTYSSLVKLYSKLGRSKDALENLQKAEKTIYSNKQELNYKVTAAWYYLSIDDYTQTWKYLQEAHQIIESQKEVQRDRLDYFRALKEYYTQTQQFQKALITQDTITHILAKRDEANIEGLYDRARIYYAMNDFLKATHYYKEYIEHMDSIGKINEDIMTGELVAILEIERLNVEKSELQQQIQHHELRDRKIVIIILIVSLLVVLLFFYREYLLNNKLRISQKELSDSNQKLLQSQKELKYAKERAEEGSRMKTDFIQNMSHEIRTPLNSIVGFSQVLSNYFSEDEDTREYAVIIEQSSTNLLQLINDVLDLSNLDGEREIFTHKTADITVICQTCIDQIRPRLKPGVTLNFLPERQSFHTLTNPDRVSQILMNLLVNATKFTERGEICLAYQIDEEKQEIFFEVTDSGIGIPANKREFIFERFAKVDTFTSGTGLGLAISRMVAEKMQGSLHVDPSYTEGSRFILTLPIHS